MDAEDTGDFRTSLTDEFLQHTGTDIFFVALGRFLKHHRMEFDPDILKTLAGTLSDKPLLGPLSLDEVRNVLLEYCSETNENIHLFVGGTFHKALKSLLSRYINEILRKWSLKGWVETSLGTNGEFRFTILVIQKGETFEQFTPTFLSLLKDVV